MAKETVTIGGGAANWCKNTGVVEDDLRAARGGDVSIRQLVTGPYLEVVGALPDGRRVRMLCPFADPCHVLTFRVIR